MNRGMLLLFGFLMLVTGYLLVLAKADGFSMMTNSLILIGMGVSI